MPDWFGHIAPNELDLAFDAPSFAQLVSNELGPWGGPDDGMDAELAGLVNDLGTVSQDLAVLDEILGISVLLGEPTGPTDLVQATPGMQANVQAANDDLGQLNALALTVGLTPFDSGAPDPSGAVGTSQTPAGEAQYNQAENTQQYTAQALNPHVSVIIYDPFDVAATMTGISLIETSDPDYFTLVGQAEVRFPFGTQELVGILNGPPAGLPAGDYYVGLQMTFDVSQGAGTGTLTLWLKITLQ